MPQIKKWKTIEQHTEERRQYWKTYYIKNRETILNNHRPGGIYAKTNNNIEYMDSQMETPTPEKTPKQRTRKPPKTPLQRKRERIARDLEDVSKRASAFRLKLSQAKLNDENYESIDPTTPTES